MPQGEQSVYYISNPLQRSNAKLKDKNRDECQRTYSRSCRSYNPRCKYLLLIQFLFGYVQVCLKWKGGVSVGHLRLAENIVQQRTLKIHNLDTTNRRLDGQNQRFFFKTFRFTSA